MAENPLEFTPALLVSHARPHSQPKSAPSHQVTDWAVELYAKQHSIALHLKDSVGSPAAPDVSHVLSIPAAKQMSEALGKAVDDYLKNVPQPETE